MDVPSRPFYLLGMGARRKLLYRTGMLIDLGSRELVRAWGVEREVFDLASYTVRLATRDGRDVTLREDEDGVWLEDGHTECLAEEHISLPTFESRPYAAALRALHQELLINFVPAGPVPNLLVYAKPWYRDAAMVALCLAKTGNLDLMREWVVSIREPFDRNNAGHREPDNLGQALYLISLFAGADHSLVRTILAALPEFERGRHIVGMSDFAEHPVYQTKWLKFGLQALGLDAPYTIPHVFDSYSALFWMDFRGEHVDGPAFDPSAGHNYPYLTWAEAHFHEAPPPSAMDLSRYPLTWEAHASQAAYEEMAIIDPEFTARGLAAPHGWHAAEMFLYLWDAPNFGARTA